MTAVTYAIILVGGCGAALIAITIAMVADAIAAAARAISEVAAAIRTLRGRP